MVTVRLICHFLIVTCVGLLLISCSNHEYTEIQIQKFPTQYQRYDRMPWEMLELEDFSKAYEVILDDFPINQYLDDFISEVFVVSSGNKFVTTQQGDFVYMVGCKPHFCDVARLYILFNPANKMVWAYAYDLGVSGNFEVWLGHPDKKDKKLMRTLESMPR